MCTGCSFRYIAGDADGSVFLVLEKGELGPLGVAFPLVNDGISSLEGAPSGKVKDAFRLAGDVFLMEVA